MQPHGRNHSFKPFSVGAILLSAACFGLLSCPVSAQNQEVQDDDPNHAAETVRARIKNLAVVPGTEPTQQDIAGTYDEDTLGASGGIAAGTKLGTPSVDVGPVTVSTSIPELLLPGAVVGSLYGHTQRKVQEFRDALADDLASASSQPLDNARVARHVYQDLQDLPVPDTRLFAAAAPIPEDVDAVLFVSINDIVIDVRDSDAVLKTTAEIALRRQSDGERLYRKWVYYQDQDSLSNWTKNDNALWRDYANFASYYLGREIAAAVLSRVDLEHTLHPAKSESVSLRRSDHWQATSKSTAPTLAWDFELLNENTRYPWAAEIDASNIYFDLEIYDAHRLVYEQQRIPETSAKLATNLEPCRTYRWTVRPSYHNDNSIRYGAWMKAPSEDAAETVNGIVGRKASSAPAYIQDFASLKINCRAR